MMKAEKGSEIITTICEYENSVAMPDNSTRRSISFRLSHRNPITTPTGTASPSNR